METCWVGDILPKDFNLGLECGHGRKVNSLKLSLPVGYMVSGINNPIYSWHLILYIAYKSLKK